MNKLKENLLLTKEEIEELQYKEIVEQEEWKEEVLEE